MVEWWSYGAKNRRRTYIQLVLSTFVLTFISFFLLACVVTTNWQAAMAISACLFPILLNTATIFSQHLLRRSADSEVCIPRSNPAGAPRPKCTLAVPCIIYGHDDIN
ncbi:hypothetical protein, partial [Xanthomonas perforans]